MSKLHYKMLIPCDDFKLVEQLFTCNSYVLLVSVNYFWMNDMKWDGAENVTGETKVKNAEFYRKMIAVLEVVTNI